MRAALGFCGLVAVVGGTIAWALLGRRDALRTVYDHGDERTACRRAAPRGHRLASAPSLSK